MAIKNENWKQIRHLQRREKQNKRNKKRLSGNMKSIPIVEDTELSFDKLNGVGKMMWSFLRANSKKKTTPNQNYRHQSR